MSTVDAFEVIPAVGPSRLVLSCEHADNRLPASWAWTDEDAWIRETHWAYDIGAARLTREIASLAKAPAVLAKFSRLLIDPNRPLASDTLIRETAEGRGVHLNRSVDDRDRTERVAYWEAYHAAFSEMARAPACEVIFAVHSFTDSYEGSVRDFEIGVLFDRDEDLGRELAASISEVASTRLNEPYSGKAGLIYAAQRHADTHGRQAVEIEVRQDRILDPSFRHRLAQAVTRVLAR